ncbi:sugar ABC transporter ATP-binding protein [Ancylobacter sonchi]|uniref:sugar ABC transporter ATP-binding protein n=1 Tax=Ancylobacter sonchi TaxID=1937790 RepID=UPI001BD21A9F|nr:sugar ABC transporter ATP-binding protein [Ancylobacter sonchi]
MTSAERIAGVEEGVASVPILDLKGVGKRFAGIVALEGIDLELRSGEVLGLLGANGSGKSTLSRIIAGETRADQGRVLIAGRALTRASPRVAAGLGVVIAHQHPSLPPHLPVWESLFLGAEICTTGGFIDRRRARRDAIDILSWLGARVDPDALAGSLTAAGQQWVEIARAVSRKPRLLILDEPSAAMTGPEVAALFTSVRRLTAEGVGIIFISHRLHEVEELCGRIVVLRNGHHAGSWSTRGRLDVPRILQLMSGDREVRERTAPGQTLGESAVGDPVVGEALLEVSGLTSGTAVRGASLTLRRGEVLGIAGLQGQGQEELLEAIAACRPFEQGTLRVGGTEVRPRCPRDMIRRGICLVPNDRHRQGLFVDGDVGSNLGYVAVAADRRPWRLPPRALAAFVRTTIERLSIKTRGPRQAVDTLSGGNQQKIVVGKWLSIPFDVILLSDPTKGVDIHARTEIYELVQDLVAADRAAIVYASDVHELLLHCSRILVMYEGRITADLAGAAMNEDRIAAASFGQPAMDVVS